MNVENGKTSYAHELFSSGSDDDVAIAFAGFICVLTSLILMISSSKRYVKIVVIISLLLQLFSLILIQVGSIYYTLFFDWNIYLLGAVMTQVIILFIAFRI